LLTLKKRFDTGIYRLIGSFAKIFSVNWEIYLSDGNFQHPITGGDSYFYFI